MRRWLIVIMLLLFSLHSVAATVPVSNMQNAVSGVVQARMKARGFASNDPRYVGTLINVGSAIAGAAAAGAAVTFAGVTAPAWASAGIVAGLGAALTYAFNLAADSAYKWLINSDGTITTSGISTSGGATGTDTGTNYLPMAQGGSYYQTAYGSDVWKCGSAYSCANAYAQFRYGSDLSSLTYRNNSQGIWFYSITIKSYTSGVWEVLGVQSYGSGAPSSCAAGTNYKGGSCVTVPGYVAPPSNLTSATLQSSINNIPSEDLSKQLNPTVLAALVNQAWMNAASQSGYSGVPYSYTDPVTVSDVQTWQSANPSTYPTVSQFVAPQPAPSGGTAATPFSLPTSETPVAQVDPATQTQTGTNPAASNPLANLGIDPGIGAPNLETTPTAQSILSPLLNLMPSLKNFTVPTHTAECPKPTIPFFGKSTVMDAHCTLLEGVRNTLYAVMAFVWVAAAMFIVLRA